MEPIEEPRSIAEIRRMASEASEAVYQIWQALLHADELPPPDDLEE